MTRRVLGGLTGLAVLVAAVIAGAGPAPGQQAAGKSREKSRPGRQAEAPVLKPGKPAAHGLREADLEGLRSILRKAVENKTLPGVSLLLAHKGEVLFREAFGDLTVDQPVKLASDSKPVSATAVMAVVDQGKMRLDDPLTKFVPEFKGTKVEKATVRRLLSHSAGVGDHFPGGWPQANTLAEFAAGVATQGSLQEPGKFRYSTVGIDLACRCAEKAAGRPFEELMREHLWGPLGMTRTRFVWGGDAAAVPEEARQRGEGRYVSGGGGLSSTLDDMAAFYQMHLNGGRYGDKQVLSRKAAVEMHRKQVAAPGVVYGLGFYLVGPGRDGVGWAFQHGGAFGTFCWADSNRQIVGIFFSQAGQPKTAPVLTAVQKKVYELIPAGR
jgi:CubicO group peptidase (beta-lactamase class C family)